MSGYQMMLLEKQRQTDKYTLLCNPNIAHVIAIYRDVMRFAHSLEAEYSTDNVRLLLGDRSGTKDFNCSSNSGSTDGTLQLVFSQPVFCLIYECNRNTQRGQGILFHCS